MAKRKNKFLTVLREYGLITLGIICYALAWDIFLIPNNLVGGGVTGIGSIIQYATHGVIRVSYSYFTINAILLVIGLLTLGKSFGVKTVYAVLVASVALHFGQELIPHDFIQAIAIDNGKLLCVIMGGMLSGFGIGLTMSQGGSTGGTDIIALLINKYRGVSPGRVILWTDAAIIFSSILVPSYTPDGALVPFVEKILVVVYGFILAGVLSVTIDATVSGSKQSVQIFITSKHYAEIADTVTGVFHRGATILHGEGWYSKEEAHVVMVLTRKTDSNVLLRAVKAIDPNAFISVSSVTGVYGRGFEALRAASRKEGKKGSK
mgnify:FL=1